MNTDPKDPHQQPEPIADANGRPAQQPTDEPQPEDHSDRDTFDHKRPANPPRDGENPTPA